VSQIATFGTMAAKAVIRDVGRVLDLGFNFVDQFAKLIPNELGITLKEARARRNRPSTSAPGARRKIASCWRWRKSWRASRATSACTPAAC
jgi:DNA polymerase III alpha subunit